MVAVNASHAKKHSVMLSVLYNLGTNFARQSSPIGSIAFRFVVPSGEKFEIGTVEGHLADWGWPKMKEDIMGSYHIAVANVVLTS